MTIVFKGWEFDFCQYLFGQACRTTLYVLGFLNTSPMILFKVIAMTSVLI